jgi:hypothetical protein
MQVRIKSEKGNKVNKSIIKKIEILEDEQSSNINNQTGDKK